MRPGFPYMERWILWKPVLEFWISRLVDEPLFLTKKLGFRCAISARREISTIPGQELQKVNTVLRQVTDCIRSGLKQFSAPAVALEFFVTIVDSYYHSEYFSRYLRRPLNLPRLDVWRKASEASVGRLSFKQEKKWPFITWDYALQVWDSLVKLVFYSFMARLIREVQT
jgi:hypothetical protein